MEFNSIQDQINSAERFEEIIFDLEEEIKGLLCAERLTFYKRDSNGTEIVSWYGADLEEEIRLPLSPTSIAGYVAMSKRSVKIDDVYDPEELAAVHPKLRFDYSYDQESGYVTRAMLVVPIAHKDTLLGVMQVINHIGIESFSAEDISHAESVADLIAQRFRYEFKATVGPYDYLLKNKKLTLDQLEEMEQLAVERDLSISSLLQTECAITHDEIGQSFEQYYQVPFFKYNPDLELDTAILDQLNKGYLAQNFWLPLAYSQDKAIVLIDDPNDAERIMEIQNVLTAQSYEFLVGTQDDILRFLGFIEEPIISEPEMDLDDLIAKLESKAQEALDGDQDVVSIDQTNPEEGVVVQLVNRIIYDAVAMNASDIHVEPSKGRLSGTVRMRVDGVCRVVLEVPNRHVRAVVSRIKVLSRLDIAERRKPQDGKLAVRMGGRPLELRIATLPTICGESVVMRILAQGDALPYDKLGFSKRNYEMIDTSLAHPHGLVLVVGPTGSGKTTTLHGLLGYLNTPERKILTAEDPVEITQPGMSQVQVQPEIGYTFAIALRAFLRCDPDIILIGEMRDHETASMGVEASLTGHLVFSTLHTNSAPETVVRLLDMGLDPLNFADALVCVVAQRLMRTLCKNCKEEYTPTQDEFDRLANLYGLEYYPELNIDLTKLKLMRAVGCEECGTTGYRGRCGVHEVLVNSKELSALIAANTPAKIIRELAVKEGMRTVQQDGVIKVFEGLSSLDQLRKVCGD